MVLHGWYTALAHFETHLGCGIMVRVRKRDAQDDDEVVSW
jgi:hypothetical protein